MAAKNPDITKNTGSRKVWRKRIRASAAAFWSRSFSHQTSGSVL
jgi:hypothetical protein